MLSYLCCRYELFLILIAAAAVSTPISRVTAAAADNYSAATAGLWLVRAAATPSLARLVGGMAIAGARAVLLVIRAATTAATATTAYT